MKTSVSVKKGTSPRDFVRRAVSYIAVCLVVISLFPGRGYCAGAVAKSASDPYREYIERYGDMAVAQQRAYGIPASITLAQGLLESAAGRSTLAREGNNHFGIKCHSTWTGASMLRDDDAPDECFRVYDSPEASFADHSEFLSRKRYSPLFEYDITDYASWARGLSACGYATDPNYADRLITIIERYSLYEYDSEGGHHEAAADFIAGMLKQCHAVRRSRGLHYVVATPGDTYAAIAKEFNMSLRNLMTFNDVEADCEIKPWEEVYLEEKHEKAPDGVKRASIGEGESLHSLAQRYGMKLSVLVALNPKASDKPGTRLRMR